MMTKNLYIMKYRTIEDLKAAGFEGFKSVRELGCSRTAIPEGKGVYMVVRISDAAPKFLTVGTGGHFKGRNPNVSVNELEENWVEGTCVVYIGKATSLNKRIGQYLRFGGGANVGHWGGRFVWQLKDSQDLLFCWKSLYDGDPEEVEASMISEFRTIYGCRPFANLKG